MEPIVHHNDSTLTLTAIVYNDSGQQASVSMSQSPADSGRFVVTDAELQAANLSEGTYDIRIEDGDGNFRGSNTLPFEWDGSAELDQLARLADSENVGFVVTPRFTRTASADQWTLIFFINGEPQNSVTNPRIKVNKRSDGSTLVDDEALTQVGDYMCKLDVTEAAKLVASGEIVEVIGKGTVNGTDIIFPVVRVRG